MGVADQGPLRNLFRLATIVAVAAGLATEAVSPSFAQTCGQDYEIKDGETLADIAERTYGSRGQWTVIFYSNQDRLGSNASLLVPGIKLRLPCIGGAGSNASAAQQTPPPVVPEQQPATGSGSIIVSSMTRKLEFLTADGYPPYTGRSLKNGGMITDIIGKAMGLVKEQSNGRVSFNVSWVNDWSAHLNPLLLTRSFDLGFPWSRPPCDNPAELDGESKFRCQRFFFSTPLYEVVDYLFVRKPSPIRSLSDGDISGTILCRPAGYSVNDFDSRGRNWLTENKVTLLRPSTVDECFRLLDAGTADGVVIAELAGFSTALALGMRDRVRTVDEPVSLTPLHVVISKGHPQARTMLYYVNASIQQLRSRGDYDKIIEEHLLAFWGNQDAMESKKKEAPKDPSSPATPAPSEQNERGSVKASEPNRDGDTGKTP